MRSSLFALTKGLPGAVVAWAPFFDIWKELAVIQDCDNVTTRPSMVVGTNAYGKPSVDTLNLLAFDFGAASGRAILGVLAGGKLQTQLVHKFPNGPVEVDGRLHWDFPRLLDELQTGLGKAAQAAVGPIASVGIDTWGVDYGLLDAEGQLLGDPYHYRDGRTDGMQQKAFKVMSAKEIFARTGIAFHSFNTVYQLLATKTQTPDILDRAETMLMMPDLLAYFLTGQKVGEYTAASTSQLVDVGKRAWSWEIIRAMGLPERIFTGLEAPGMVKGELCRSVRNKAGLDPLKVIAVAGHDTASAVAATPLTDADSAYLSSGTWSLLGVEVSEPVVTAEARKWNFTNEGGTDGTIRLLRNIAGLWILQECKRQWACEGISADYEELVKLGAAAEGLASFIDPDAEVFALPGDMPTKIVGFCREFGQSPPENIGQTVRCILESLALKYRWAFERLEELLARKISVLHVVGGGSRNGLLAQFIASAIDRPVVCGPAEASAIGNLLVQARGLGGVGDLSEARRIVGRSFPVRRYYPEAPGQWDDAYRRYERLLKACG